MIKWASGIGALRCGPHSGFGMGRALRLTALKLCCWLFGLGGVLGCQETFIAGVGLFSVGKGERVALGAWGTN